MNSEITFDLIMKSFFIGFFLFGFYFSLVVLVSTPLFGFLFFVIAFLIGLISIMITAWVREWKKYKW